MTTQNWASEISWVIDDVGSSEAYSNYNTVVKSFCIPLGVHTLAMSDSYGDGWNGATLSISSADGNRNFLFGAGLVGATSQGDATFTVTAEGPGPNPWPYS